ncbi:MAG: DUF1737 domain-containing protein [Acidobacteriota bacterium]|nr:DUF1737 domain-containing protein [Acidobacteriota bacterium]
MKYYVLTNQNRGEFIDQVNFRIADGWEPIGGVAFCPNGTYNQALIKRDKA